MLKALSNELQLRKDELQNVKIETIYFGGGTPSLLTNKDLRLLIEQVYNNYQVVDNPEITLEANPDDLSNQQIQELANSQINRLSIGIQSFFDDDLNSMNRVHSSEEAKQCLSLASQLFDNITVDLIYGIPNMSLEKWNENLKMTFDFGVNHISSYALTVEPKTALESFIKRGTYPAINEELSLEHFNHLVNETKNQGFVHYEISNFGKPSYFSKHNTSYWQGKSYLGIGPSAHSFDGKLRSWNVSNNTKYIQAIQRNELPRTVESLSANDRFNEYIMTGLRTIWGISLDKIEKDFGKVFRNELLKSAQPYLENGLLEFNYEILTTTQKGKFLADGMASELFRI